MSLLSLSVTFLQLSLVTFLKIESVVSSNEELAIAEDGI